MNLLLAVVAGLWYWYAMCRVGYTLQHIFCQPLVMAVPFGLIMGDLSTALIIGAGIEMMYVGLVTNGGNIPADECLAGVVAIPIALASGMDAQSAIVLALPFGLLGVLMDQIKRFINGYFANLADKYAEQGNDKGIERCTVPHGSRTVIAFSAGVHIDLFWNRYGTENPECTSRVVYQRT